MNRPSRSSQGGFSLSEVLVASAIFLFIAVVAFTAFESSRESYKTGENRAEMQQRTRLSFDLMLEELRLAGFDFNRDGDQTVYPDQTDEQLEWLGESALAFRANLDYTNSESGRESSYEIGPSDPDFGLICCPIVTTGNDEIIAYALRSDEASKNTDSMEFKTDTSIPRDAGWDPGDGSVIGEELIEIDNLDFSNDNPPYTLYRFHIEEDGSVASRPMASNVRSMSFLYESATGEDYYCLSAEGDGTCASGNQLPFALTGGADHVSGVDMTRRDAREAVRRIHVEIVGMVEEDDRRFVDAEDSLFPHRQKMRLATLITPQNLGIQGAPDIESRDAGTPTDVTLCGGQCNTIRVEWDEVSGAGSYQVNLFTAGSSTAFFTTATPGIAIPGSDPERVYAVYQAIDHAQIQEGASLVATVQSRPSAARLSDESDRSLPETVRDISRIEAPSDVKATGYDPEASGWPAVVDADLDPLTNAESNRFNAQGNSIVVSWRAPEYALDVLDQSDPAGTWTTAEGGAQPALACDAQAADTDFDGSMDRLRTRSRELRGGSRYLIFRSTEPRFVPTAADLVAEVSGEVAVVDGRVSFEDRTLHEFSDGIFSETRSALQNCMTYYYRIRAVDSCWGGGDPASLSDAHLSPFAPRLNPDLAAQNSDNVVGLSPSLVGHAIPGFAVPKARPEAPRNITFSNFDSYTGDGDGFDVLISFDTVKRDTFEREGPLGGPSVPAPEDVTIVGYKIFSHPSDPNFPLSDALAGTGGTRLDKIIWLWKQGAGRASHDDEDGNGSVSPHEDESILPAGDTRLPLSGLRIDLPNASTRFYRALAFSCNTEMTVPSVSDPTAFDYSALSEAVQFPCRFGGGETSTIYQDISDFDNSVTSVAYPERAEVAVLRAWLILIDPATGNQARSASPVTVDAGGVAFFDAAHIAALTNNFGNGRYFVKTEMEDENACKGVSDQSEIAAILPACCLEAELSPPHLQTQPTEVVHDVHEFCYAQNVQIQRITLDIVKYSGPLKRYTQVWWGSELIWTGSALSPVIDRRANPLILVPGENKRLRFVFSRNPDGSDLFITYDYKIGGASGSCSFETRGI